MPSLTEKLSIIIDAHTGGAVKEFDKTAKSAKDLEASSSRTGKALQSMGLSGKISGEALKAGLVTGLAAAGAAAISFGVASVKHFTEAAQSVRAFQRVTGQSAEEASHFVAAFDDMGVSADQASSAMFKLSKNISTGGQKLTELGIGIEHTASGATDLKGTFLNIADAVSKTSDPAKRAEIAFAAFGKTGAALLPILEKGRAGIEKLFKNADLNFSQAQLDSAEDYRLALDHLSDSVGKVQNRLGAALVPSLAKAAEGMAVIVDKTTSATESSDLLGKAFGFLTAGTPLDAIRGVVTGLGLLSDNSDESAASVEDLVAASGYLGTSLESLEDKTKDQVAALVEEKKALDGVLSATLAQFDANFAYQDSLNATEDAAAKVAEAQKALNEAIRAHTANSPEATAATEALSRALLAQQEQALQSANAAGRLAEQQALANGATDATLPKLKAQIAELERQKGQIDGRNTPAIQGMIDKLNAIKAQYSTNVVVNGVESARADLLGLDRLLGNLTGTTHRIPVTTTLVPSGSGTGTRPSNSKTLVPQFHDGGVYHAPNGTEGLALLKDGETVLPPGRGVGGGPSIVIHAGLGTDPSQLEEAVVRAFRRWQKRNPHLN